MAVFAFAATGISAWAVWLLKKTLEATHEAVNSAERANDLIRSEQRPWLTITDVGFSLVWPMQYSHPEMVPKDFVHYGGNVKWKLMNSGSQPAQNVMVETEFFDRFVAVDGPMPFKEIKGLWWSNKDGESAVELGAQNALKAATERLDSFPHRKCFLSPGQTESFDTTDQAFFFKSPKERGRPLAEGDKRAVLICISYTSLNATDTFRTYGVYEVVVIDHPFGPTSDLPFENVENGIFGLRQISGEMT